MKERRSGGDRRQRYLAAPWRWEFISALGRKDGCIFCQAFAQDERDSMLCYRGERFFILLNRYPYSSGHLMVAPIAHLDSPERLAAGELSEMWELTRRSLAVLRENYRPDGFNIGMNIGPAAGAGVKDHFHQHIVPRWQGDANFMAVTGGTRVQSYDLAAVLATLRAAFAK